ncbi:MAG: hypothetical protein JST75_09425 [Bacteroidetes bacterium]|nr:hypothetical protein [Bacteroidota bacterium]
MKKHASGIIALTLAILIFSFTTSHRTKIAHAKQGELFFVYNGTGAQNSIMSYSQTVLQPNICNGLDNLCWFKMVSGQTFLTVFNSLDKNHDGIIDFRDQSEDHIRVELKN